MAGPTRASGHPDYASSGTTGTDSRFIPEIWSGKIAPKFYRTTVLGDITNNDWEGEVKQKGDIVTIRTRPTITVRDYEVGGGLTYEKPTSADLQLNLNRAKYWGVELEDVDRVQSDLMLMNEFSTDASEQMAITVDADVLGGIYSSASASNAGTTAGTVSSSFNLGSAASIVSITSANVIDYITRHASVLQEANITGQYWMVLPVWMCNRILNSDLKDASLSGDSESIVRNGRVGKIADTTIYMSNQLKVVGSGTNIISGVKSCVAFASQITKVEDLRNPNDFGDIIRGLNVYGYKVVNGDGITHGVVQPG